MSEPLLFALPGSPKASRLRSFLLSAGVHAVTVATLIAAHRSGLVTDRTCRPERIADTGRKIIWYSRTLDLPPIAPLEPAPSVSVRADQFHPRQNIAASAPHAESRRQIVIQPPPQLRLGRDIRSPNVLVFNPPSRVEAPAPKPQFSPPARAPAGPRALPQVEAPQVAAAAAAPLPAAMLPARIPAPEFKLPQPQAPPVRAPQPIAGPDAPQIAAGPAGDGTLARLTSEQPISAPQFALPQRTGNSRKPAAVPPLAALSPGVPVISGPQQPGTVIVGLDPSPGEIEAPPGSRSAQFSAGPVTGGKDNGTLAASARADIHVPNLGISPGASAAGPAVTRPPASPDDRAAFRRQLMASIAAKRSSPPGLPPSKPEPGGPNLVLHGSTVYTLAIDMPNVTSYEGSWILRFTELGGSSPDDVLTAPMATRKVDPKYIASAAEERIEGKVLLYAVIRRDGRVDHIRLVQGIDERLDESALAAFAKWEFQPATKNGEPVDLEAVVQIPFRLRPRRKY
jgi:TonB family protein